MADIVCYYCREWRVWVVYSTDTDGNQLWDAHYYLNREALEASFK